MSHVCHAINCKIEVPPEMLMCKKHWFMVPKDIRNQIWEHYRSGQCNDKKPSREWLMAAKNAIKTVWEKENS